MSLVVKELVCEQMPEGLHNVKITKVEGLGSQKTRFGEKDTAVSFTADDQNEGEPVDVRGKVCEH
jgi:hypothetical protein